MYCTCGTYIIPPYPDVIQCPCGKVSTVDDLSNSSSSTNEFKNKPGTALESLIPDWVVQFKKGCGCKDFRKKMDGWGTEGCIARENQIVGHLLNQNDKLIPMFRGIPMSLKKIAAKKLLAKAIELSR